VQRSSRIWIAISSGLVFIMSVTGMFYYGYKTFYVDKETVETTHYTDHYVLISEEMGNDYWALIEEGAQQVAAENSGMYLDLIAPEKADNDQLLRLLDRTISMGVDGIITQGVAGERFVELVQKGTERGIPILTIDSDVQGSERMAYIGTDNFLAGQLVAQSIIEQTTDQQFIGIVMGRADSINQRERLAGLKEGIQSNEQIQIVGSMDSNITRIGAAQATYSLIKKYPEITTLVGMSALDGIGMVDGLGEIAPNKEVYITAFDVLPETLTLIDNGEIAATIAQDPEEMGRRAMDVMLEIEQEEYLEEQIFTPTEVIDKAKAKQYGERK